MPLIQRAFNQAKQSLANVASESEFNQFIQDFVGPMVAHPDGTIQSKASFESGDSSAGAQMAEAICARARVRNAFWTAVAA